MNLSLLFLAKIITIPFIILGVATLCIIPMIVLVNFSLDDGFINKRGSLQLVKVQRCFDNEKKNTEESFMFNINTSEGYFGHLGEAQDWLTEILE